jgi:hypothetical protein
MKWVLMFRRNPLRKSPGPVAMTANVCGFSQIIKNLATNAPFLILSDPLLNTQPTITRSFASLQ